MKIRYTFLFFFLTLSACSLGVSQAPAVLPTATTVRVIPATIVPTFDRQAQVVAQVTHTPQPATATPNPCESNATQPPATYKVRANLHYVERAAIIQQTVEYRNRSSAALDQVVLAVEANQWPGAFTLHDVSLGRTTLGYELTGRRLTVDLPESLSPGCTVSFTLDFRVDVPAIGAGLSAYKGFFGYSERQINLAHWLPVVAPRIDGAWVVREAVLIGEQAVMEVADWQVRLNVAGAPENLTVAGPGIVTHTGTTWNFEASGLRDFTLSLSDRYNVLMQTTPNGVVVEVYTFADALVRLQDGTEVNGADYVLSVAVRAVEMYEDLYGTYPFGRLAIVEGDFPDGMEFSGVVFVSRDWFLRFDGNPASWLTVITVHEVAHQWWYASVGSDQALMPWLDEALATYSEYVYFEEYHPDLKAWWWQWRVDNYGPQGKVDTNVYHYGSIREYINSVYLLGARMLHELRADLGTEAFFAFLQRYYATGAGRMADADMFWSVMTEDELAASLATRLRYFIHAGPEQ